MAKPRRRPSESASLVPVALTIAGSDCSAGAGIQADLKTFAALGVYGLTAVTCVVAEIPGKVSRIEAVTPRIVRDQIEVLLRNFQVGAIKTGLLCSEANRFRCGKSPSRQQTTYPARDRSGNDCDQRRPPSGTCSYRRLQKETVSARDRHHAEPGRSGLIAWNANQRTTTDGESGEDAREAIWMRNLAERWPSSTRERDRLILS